MIKLVTYNIECGLQVEKLRNTIRDFSKQGVNIFCLQEVRKLKNKPFIGDLFLKDLGSEWRAEYFSHSEFGSVGLALCIIWNAEVLNLTETERVMLPKVDNHKLWERIFLKSVHGHLNKKSWLAFLWNDSGPYNLDRGALVCNFICNGIQFRLINTHLDWAGGIKQRVAQIKYIHDHLKRRPEVEKEVLCGDFNTLGIFVNFKKRSDQVLKYLPDGFTDVLVEPKSTAKPFQRLDYIFAKGFSRFSTKVERVKGSDHKPIIAYLEI